MKIGICCGRCFFISFMGCEIPISISRCYSITGKTGKSLGDNPPGLLLCLFIDWKEH